MRVTQHSPLTVPLPSCDYTPSRLIYDIGFHNGDDTAYYLSKGYNVLAIEASPILADQGKERFAAAIAAGQLTLLNLAMWERSGETLTFYINDADSGWSSLHPELGKKGGKHREVTIQTIAITDLFAQYGVPWYLKIDIEGSDEMVVRGLARNGPLPKYLSFELPHGCEAVALLEPLGYTHFKLISQASLTQSLPIFETDYAMRVLRKLGGLCPPFHSFLVHLPRWLRPRKILWDTFRERLPYRFSRYTTGPFGEDTEGSWKSGREMTALLKHAYEQYAREGKSDKFWFDLHAKSSSLEC